MRRQRGTTSFDVATVKGVAVTTGAVVTVPLTAAAVATWALVADRPLQLVAVREVHSVVGSTSAAVRPRKVTDTSAPGATAGATVKELTTAAIDLTAAINVVQSPALSATVADLKFAAGDKLGLNFSGTLTGLVGVLTLVFKQL